MAGINQPAIEDRNANEKGKGRNENAEKMEYTGEETVSIYYDVLYSDSILVVNGRRKGRSRGTCASEPQN